MRTAALWGLLALLCQHTLVSGHILGKTSTRDLDQLKSLLEHFEEVLAEVAQEEDSDDDFEETNQESEHSQEEEESLLEKPPSESHSKSTSQRSRLQDLLMTAKKRASSCFGARMDRIGNASGLGCNGGKG